MTGTSIVYPLGEPGKRLFPYLRSLRQLRGPAQLVLDRTPRSRSAWARRSRWRRGMRWTARSSRGWSLPISPRSTPRENGGNFDVKQLTKGAKLFLPVFKEGGLFSTGDGHFAQGDGEVCVTAVEMGATAVVRFRVHKGLAQRRKFSSPVFSRQSYFADPRFAAPERFLGVMGMPINAAGEIEAENLTLACRNAVLNMIGLLQERGFNREQAYVI